MTHRFHHIKRVTFNTPSSPNIVYEHHSLNLVRSITGLVTATCFLTEDIVLINSTSSQLTYICNCPTSMMTVKTAVCVGNGTWLLQILCGRDVCISTDDGKVAGGQYS